METRLTTLGLVQSVCETRQFRANFGQELPVGLCSPPSSPAVGIADWNPGRNDPTRDATFVESDRIVKRSLRHHRLWDGMDLRLSFLWT